MDNKENDAVILLVVIDLNKNSKKKLFFERFGDMLINNVYRIIYFIVWSKDSRYVVISILIFVDLLYIWVFVVDILIGKIMEFIKNIGLCFLFVNFFLEDKFIFL